MKVKFRAVLLLHKLGLASGMVCGWVATLGAAEAGGPPSAAAGRAPAESLAPSFARFFDGERYAGPAHYLRIERADLITAGTPESGRALADELAGFNFPRAAIDDGSAHLPAFSFRGLSPDHTLVLVEGHRRHTTALLNVNSTIGRGAVTTSLGSMPLGALDGIEVLADGAAPAYGSGGFGGTFNLRLREDLGRHFSAFWGRTREGDGDTRQVTFGAGGTLAQNGVIHASVGWRERGDTDRAVPDTRQQYLGTVTGTTTKTAISGSVESGTSPAPAGITFDPREATAHRDVQRFGDARLRDQMAVVNGRLPVGREQEVYAMGDYLLRRGESAAFFRRPGDSRVVRALWPDGFMPLLETRIVDWSMIGGWRGRTQGWFFDLTLSSGVNTIAYDVTNTNNASLGTQSPREMYAGKLGYAESAASADLARSVSLGLVKPAEIALGLEHRRENYWIKAGAPDSWRNGGVPILDGPDAGRSAPEGAQGFPGFRPSDEIDAVRRVEAAHVELTQGINRRLLVALSARYERTSDAGETTDGKAAGRLSLGGGLAVRGSVGTSLRQPHLAQQWFSSTATNFIGGQAFENRTFPVSNPVAQALGAKDLMPERGTTMNAGLAWSPLPAFDAQVDFYRVDIRDRLILSSNFIGSAVGTFLESKGVRGATGGRFFSNEAATRTEGFDATVRWRWEPGQGRRLTLQAMYDNNRSRLTRVGATPSGLAAVGITTPLFDLTEEVRLTRGTPRETLRLGAVWESGRWQAGLHLSRAGEMEAVALTNANAEQIAALTPGFRTYTVTQELRQTLVGGGGAPQIGGATTVTQVVQIFDAKWLTDVDLHYRLTDGLRVSVGATNLFNIYPTRNLASRVVNGRAYSGSDNGGTTPFNAMTPTGFNGAFFYSRMDLRF